MPPELLTLQRKRERLESMGSVSRWRGSSSHHGQREFNRRASTDFRRHTGHGRQGGWLFSEEYVNGYAPPHLGDKMLEDECKPYLSPDDRKYVRNSRENQGSFSQGCWRGYSAETRSGSPDTYSRPREINNYHSDSANTMDQHLSKDQHDIGDVDGYGACQRYGKQNQLGPLEWKTLKWARSGSFSSRGFGFNNSVSPKSMGAVDSNEAKMESQTKNVTPLQSPLGNAATCDPSAAPSEETGPRKKPRLKWGEGLAKYEKKKVDVPNEGLNRNVSVFCASSSEPAPADGSNLSDKSPRVTDCSSPATPPSFACSSSPGLEEKSFIKAANNNYVSNLCMLPGSSHQERFPFDLEKLDVGSIANLGPITELSQLEDPSPADCSFVRSTAMSKLAVWKGDISKVLEITETEIDILENELKSLKSESGGRCVCPAASGLLPVESNAKACQEQGVMILRPVPLQINSCGDTILEMALCNGALEEVHADVKDDDVDSPGTATSKFVEPLNERIGNSIEAQGANAVVNKIGIPTCIDGNVFGIKNDDPVSRDPSFYAERENILCKLILDSNKESADQASEVLNKVLPRNQYEFGVSKVTGALVFGNASLIREKIAMRKNFLRFKEGVITLKFKILRHLWKEDLHVLSIKKYRSKSQRKIVLGLPAAHNGRQKHQLSIRPRLLSPARNSSMVPTAGIMNFTSKMRLDSQIELCRDALKMPALILDREEKTASRFATSNGLVEDPCAVEKERAMINPWTPEEIEIFLGKLAILGKDFRNIASFLNHKTTADCVEFYYKNHKFDYFKKTKKLDAMKQGKSSTYLKTSRKKWNSKINVASLDMLGTVSLMAADADSNVVNRHTERFHLGDYSDSKISRGCDGILGRTTSFVLSNERDTAAADVLAGICGSISSEAMGSCITSSVDPGEGYHDRKYQKVDSTVKRPSTPDVTQDVDGETCSDDRYGEIDSVDWTDEEKSIFIHAVLSHGKDFLKISRCVRTRSRDQCKVFFSKARKCLGLDLLHPGHGNRGDDDENGGDDGDTCFVESGSVVCSDKPVSPVNIMNHDESSPVKAVKKIKSFSDAVVTSITVECEMEDRPGSDSDSNKYAIDVSQLVHASTSSEGGGEEPATQQVVTQSVCGPSGCDPVPDDTTGVSEISVERSRNEVEGPESLFSGCSRDVNCNASTIDLDNGLQCSTKDSNSVLNTSYLAAQSSSCSGFILNSEYGQQSSFPLNSMEKRHAISMHQERSLAAVDSYLQCSAVSQNKQCRNSVSRDDYQQKLSGVPILNRVESSPILRGYPLQIPQKKIGELSRVQLPDVQGLSESERNFSVRNLAQGCFVQKCNRSVAKHPVLPINLEQASDQPKSHSQNSSDTEKPSRNGDVKLFGKILTTTSLRQSNSNFNPKGNEKKTTHHPKLSSRSSSTLRFNGHDSMNRNSNLLKSGCNNYSGLENIPTSYGLWDGNKAQNGLSSLADSAIFLAKYPAAFANYRMDKQTAEGSSLDRVFPVRGIRSRNGVADYQVYRSVDGPQPFTVDMKQQADMLLRRNGSIPSLQQQGRGMDGW